MAATLALGSGTVLSHRSAAELWGLIPHSDRAAEVTRPTNARRRPRIVAHRVALPDDERTVIDGIPVTSTPRTILDLASVLAKRQLERAMNEAEVLQLTDRLSVPDLLERYPRRRGAAALRAILGDETAPQGVTQNEFEEGFVDLLDAHALPAPRLNVDVMAGGRHFNADCLWAAERLIVELDGRAVHGTNRAFEADRERDRILLASGWRVMRVTWRQFQDDAPAVVADLDDALRRGPR